MSTYVTIREIAALAGVSPATVSNVLNGRSQHVSAATTNRVLETVRQINYRRNKLAKGLASKHSEMLGLVTAHMAWPFSAAVSNAQATAFRLGYDLLVCDNRGSEHNELPAVQSLIDRHVDGIIFVASSAYRHDAALTAVKNASIPFVMINRVLEQHEGMYILVDNESGTYAATCHLLEQGHRRIGYFHLPVTGPSSTAAAQERLEGYHKALRDYQVAYRETWVRGGTGPESKTAPQIIASSIAYDMLRQTQPPTAILCGNDFLAVGVMRAAMSLGLRIPDDLVVIGHDDSLVAMYTTPPLTSVRQPMDLAGTRAAEVLIQHIWHNTKPQGVEKLPCELVVRDSSLAHINLVTGSAYQSL